MDGALCSGWVYVPNLGLRVYNSVRNITIEDLICIGASSGIFYKICIGALSCILLKVAFGHLFSISLWIGLCVLVEASVLNLGLRVFDSVRNISTLNLLCIGA